MPRALPVAWLRWSRGSPMCQSPVPALSMTMRSCRPAAFTRWRITASAVGERQMLARQTKQRRTGEAAIAAPASLPGFGRLGQRRWRSRWLGGGGRRRRLVGRGHRLAVGAVLGVVVGAVFVAAVVAGHRLGIDDAGRFFLGQQRLDLGRRAQSALAPAPLARLLVVAPTAARLAPLQRPLVPRAPQLQSLGLEPPPCPDD